MTNQTPRVRVSKAIRHLGGDKQLAEFLGIHVEAIYNWKREKRTFVPDIRAYQIAAQFPELVDS